MQIMQLALAGVAGSGPYIEVPPTYWPSKKSGKPSLKRDLPWARAQATAAIVPPGNLTQRKMPGLRCTAESPDCFQSGLQSENDNEQFPSEDELSVGRKGSH